MTFDRPEDESSNTDLSTILAANYPIRSDRVYQNTMSFTLNTRFCSTERGASWNSWSWLEMEYKSLWWSFLVSQKDHQVHRKSSSALQGSKATDDQSRRGLNIPFSIRVTCLLSSVSLNNIDAFSWTTIQETEANLNSVLNAHITLDWLACTYPIESAQSAKN